MKKSILILVLAIGTALLAMGNGQCDMMHLLQGGYDAKILTPTEMDSIFANSQSPITNCQKLIRDGQLIILRDGVEYNAMGVELK